MLMNQWGVVLSWNQCWPDELEDAVAEKAVIQM